MEEFEPAYTDECLSENLENAEEAFYQDQDNYHALHLHSNKWRSENTIMAIRELQRTYSYIKDLKARFKTTCDALQSISECRHPGSYVQTKIAIHALKQVTVRE